MKNKVLVIGGIARDHAVGWKLAQSPQVEKVFFAPGNGGTTVVGENVSLDVTDHQAIIEWCKENEIDLVVPTGDDFLAAGIIDDLTAAGIKAFGPTKAAAQIEWSKAFAKEVMEAAGVPTAKHKTFTDYEDAKEYLSGHDMPVVIKASGLALGKGVVIAQTQDEAQQALKAAMVDKTFGDAGNEIVIEEFMEGQEFSVHAWCDGTTSVLFPTSQDHKRIGEGDTGLNTGGMGVVAPLPWVSDDDMARVKKEVVDPLLAELAKRGAQFKGLLYPGLMMTKDGPKVVEFNARFGDPECQTYMRLLDSDLFAILDACTAGTLKDTEVKWKNGAVSCIMLASQGYPGSYEKGKVISGIDVASGRDTIEVFHAGTKLDGQLLTNGGRVLAVTALGSTLQQALDRAYEAVGDISFDGMQYRRDIGKKSL